MSETERLIKAVRECPLLYNTSHVDYKNLKKREKAWHKISEYCGGNVNVDWKKKWKNLKDSYVKYLKAEYAKTAKEHSILKRYQAWPWASKMEFVRPFCKIKIPPESNQIEKQWFELPDGVLSEDSLKGFPEDEELENYEEQIEIKLLPKLIQKEDSEMHDMNVGNLTFEFREEKSRSKARKKRTNSHLDKDQEFFIEPPMTHIHDDNNLEFDSKEGNPHSKAANKKRKSAQPNSTHSDIELVLMGYAKTIKTFTPKRQTMVKFKFSQILMEAELEQQEEDELIGPIVKKKLRNQRSCSPLSYEESSDSN